MVESIFRRAKAFIGLEEGSGGEKEYGQQLDMNAILKGRKELKGDPGYAMMCYEPKVCEDSLNISTHLRSGSPVIINLKHLDPAEGTRLVDFVCGTAYAIDGHMMKIGDTIFLFTPNNISIISEEEKNPVDSEINLEGGRKERFFSR